MIDWKTGRWVYSSDLIYMGDKKINEIWMGNLKIYPESNEYYWIQTPSNTKYLDIGVAAIWFYKNKMHYSVYIGDKPFSMYWDAVRQIWVFETWGGLNHIDGRNIWTDGYFVFLKDNDVYYRLNPINDTWEILNWDIDTSYTNYLTYMWTDGENIYYSRSSKQYVLNKETLTWYSKSWQGSGLNYPNGHYIWYDGENVYYSSGTRQYILNKSTSTWSTKTWSGLQTFNGDRIWTDTTNIYCTPSTSETYNSYILNRETDTWESITWNVKLNSINNYIWNDGANCFYEYGGPYILDKQSKEWVDTHMYNHMYDGCEEPEFENSNEVILKGENGGHYYSDNYIWNDGVNYYITSYFSSSYELYYKNFIIDPINDIWNDCLYNSIVKNPEYLWSDGENIYYSRSRTEQYVFNKSTKTWSEKTWYYKVDEGHTFDIKDIEAINAYRYSEYDSKRFADFIPYGTWVWTDGDNIYTNCKNDYAISYNSVYNNFILNKSTSTWERIIFDGMSETNNRIYPDGIWSDGKTVFYNFGRVFNKSSKSFSTVEWTKIGIDSFRSSGVFTDGNTIYIEGLVLPEGSSYYESVLCVVDTNSLTIKKPPYSDNFWNTKMITGDIVKKPDYNTNYYVYHDTIYSYHGWSRKVFYKKFNKNTNLARTFAKFEWRRYLL